MRVLVWVPPWIAQGDTLFFENTLRRHLVCQANAVARAGCEVTMIVGDLLVDRLDALESSIRVDTITVEACKAMCGLTDPSIALYASEDSTVDCRLLEGMRSRIEGRFDVVLLWETPVPFLQRLLPQAVFLHQMPGSMSRAPFPQTVTVDAAGLYRKSTLTQNWSEIVETPLTEAQSHLVTRYKAQAASTMGWVNPFSRGELDLHGSYAQLLLVPLQVSGHYGFRADTPYATQAEFLFDVLTSVPREVGVVVTQYVSSLVNDRIMTPDFVASVKQRWPNLIFEPRFDEIRGISQYLTPIVDGVQTCSSSLGIQAVLWDKQLLVDQPTFLKPIADGLRSHDGALGSAARERLLAFVLTRQQPLTRVTQDPGVLLAVLEDLLRRKRAGLEGVEALPDYLDLIPGYEDEVINGFRGEIAAKEVGTLRPQQRASNAELSHFRKEMNDGTIEYISFDLFDTLVNRPVSAPADLYKLLEQRLIRRGYGQLIDFERARLNAEVITREVTERGEIRLREIYAAIQKQYGLTDVATQEMMALECELEIESCRAREFGKRTWALAQEVGKPIIIVTDTYLPRSVIETLLEKCGYGGYFRLYVSSEVGVRKREGGLFDRVVQDLGVTGSRILHIGDHDVADVVSAQERGMRTRRAKRAIERMSENPRYAERLGLLPAHRQSLGRSVVAALTAHRLFDGPGGGAETRSHFFGDAFNLGYAGLGPAIAGFALWLGGAAAASGTKQLFFLSREGDILLRAYDALHGGADVPKGQYLYASRRALRVAGIHDVGDALAVLSHEYTDGGATVEEFMHARFGLNASIVRREALMRAGFSGPWERVSTAPGGRDKLARLVLELSSEILARSSRERMAYMSYLSTTGIIESDNAAIVDIGWAGNMQAALSNMIERPLDGYYYATLHTAQVWGLRGTKMHAFAGTNVTAHNASSAFVRQRPIVEYLLCNGHGSLLCFEQSASGVRRVLQIEADASARQSLISRVHQGIVAYAQDLRDRVGADLGQLVFEPSVVESTFGDYLTHPAAMDAAMLRGHFQEDVFGGLAKRWLIHAGDPTKDDTVRESYWRPGARSLMAAKKNELNDGAHRHGKRGSVSSNGVTPAPTDRSGLPFRVEDIIVKATVNSRKYAKYKRERTTFFEDSRHSAARWWGRWTGGAR